MKLFEKFLNKYPPVGELKKPNAEILEQFQDLVPNELLEFWQEYGFGNYGDGLLKVIDPTEYMDNLYTWLGEEDLTRLPILMTAFGNILYYRRLSETEEDICLKPSKIEDDICVLDIHYRRIMTCTSSFKEFFEDFIVDDEIAEELLEKELFEQAVKAKGALEEQEIYFFVPALALGGSRTLEYIEKGNAVIHQQLLFQMGMEDSESEGDAWSQAYEANPHVFKKEDGTLLVNFTLTETVDTILPLSPETMYAVEGETISQWVLTFFNLIDNNIVGMLSYQTALQLLQPYIIETRGDNVMLRGLSLEEMKNIISE